MRAASLGKAARDYPPQLSHFLLLFRLRTSDLRQDDVMAGSTKVRARSARPVCPLCTVTASPPTPVSRALHERRASEPWLLLSMRRAGCWHSASAALRHCGFQSRCRLSACSARWRSSRYRLRCAHQRRRSACRALTAQRGRVGGLASPRASWSMRSRSGQASRRSRPSWCSVQVRRTTSSHRDRRGCLSSSG